MKNIKRRITALALAGALVGTLGVATSEVAEPAVVEVAQSIGIDLPSSAEPAEALTLYTPTINCWTPYNPNRHLYLKVTQSSRYSYASINFYTSSGGAFIRSFGLTGSGYIVPGAGYKVGAFKVSGAGVLSIGWGCQG